LNALLTLVIKDLKLLQRDRVALLLLMLAPLVVITVAGFSLSTLYRAERHTFPVADLDDGEVSRKLLSELEASNELDVLRVDSDEAKRLVADTPLAGSALVIPKGFSDGFIAGEPVELLLWTDPVKHLEALKIRAAVERARAGLMATQVAARISVVQVLTHAPDADFEAVFADSAELASRLLDKSVLLEETSVFGGSVEFNSFDQNVPGFSVTFLLLGMLFGVGVGLLDEQEWGMLQRISASPVSVKHLATGKMVSRFLVGTVQMVLLFAFGWVAFDISLGPSIVALACVILGITFASSAFGLLAATLAPSREAVLPMGTMAVVAMAAIGGCWWPITIEPFWLQKVAHVFPTAWAMDAFNDLMLRQRGFADVVPALAALVGFGCLYMVAGWWLYERRSLS
jgi:ABC-2 type transport system permease protein